MSISGSQSAQMGISGSPSLLCCVSQNLWVYIVEHLRISESALLSIYVSLCWAPQDLLVHCWASQDLWVYTVNLSLHCWASQDIRISECALLSISVCIADHLRILSLHCWVSQDLKVCTAEHLRFSESALLCISGSLSLHCWASQDLCTAEHLRISESTLLSILGSMSLHCWAPLDLCLHSWASQDLCLHSWAPQDLFFFLFGFYGPFKNISLISSRSFIKSGRKPENPEKKHLTIRKQNLAFPHMTRARLEPQRWET